METLFTHIKWKLPDWKCKEKREKKTQIKTDYKNPKLSGKEEIVCFLEAMVILILFSYFFYRSIWACIILSPGIWLYRKEKRKKLWKKRRERLEEEFKDTLLAIQTNLQSGYSIENAFLESYPYVVGVFGASSDMAKELVWIKKGLGNGDTLEHLLLDLAYRCPNSALEDFSNVYSVLSRTGGNWNEIIGKIVGQVMQRIELQEEINILIHGKKMESRMMCIIPFFILFYMDTTSKGYFDVMYHNIIGVCIMTICMVAYVFAFIVAEKLTEIL